MKDVFLIMLRNGDGSSMRIHDDQYVWEFQKMIMNAMMYCCDPSEFDIYLAKKADGTWVSGLGPDVRALEKRVITDDLRAFLAPSQPVDPSMQMGDPALGLPDEADWVFGDVHVLVDMPNYGGKEVPSQSRECEVYEPTKIRLGPYSLQFSWPFVVAEDEAETIAPERKDA